MPLPTIQRADLTLLIENLIIGRERLTEHDRDNLRDIRRCCAVLTAEDVRLALESAARVALMVGAAVRGAEAAQDIDDEEGLTYEDGVPPLQGWGPMPLDDDELAEHELAATEEANTLDVPNRYGDQFK